MKIHAVVWSSHPDWPQASLRTHAYRCCHAAGTLAATSEQPVVIILTEAGSSGSSGDRAAAPASPAASTGQSSSAFSLHTVSAPFMAWLACIRQILVAFAASFWKCAMNLRQNYKSSPDQLWQAVEDAVLMLTSLLAPQCLSGTAALCAGHMACRSVFSHTMPSLTQSSHA